ncbi:hypothetical protein [Vibrio owensii]|uniref:hypothetical protein n=1 Tax=Vibrio owensii TaxID=696485 RepID=UPI0018F15A98|nr:hypothetical protein [Vibrio owensii]
MIKRKFLLSSILAVTAGICAMPSMAASTVAPAAAGDQSSGDVVFSGYVPGFVAGDAFIVTGLGGTIASQYKGDLSINEDGTFTTMKPVILEAHDYDKTTDPANPVVGDLHASDWAVKSINTTNATLQKVLDTVELHNGTNTVTSADLTQPIAASGDDTLSLTLTNGTPITGEDIAGQTFTVDVVMVATAQ